MIKYALRCDLQHEFEAWFQNSDRFDEQKAAGSIHCPVCGSHAVEKAPMAPRINNGSLTAQSSASDDQRAALRQAALELRQAVEEKCDYVGTNFAEEARKIHYGEVDERNIYGEASLEESKELSDEGIEVMILPWTEQNDA